MTPSDAPTGPPAAQVAAADRPLQVTIACDASQFVSAMGTATGLADAIRTAPCEPLRAPDRPDHVARAKANRAAHYRALGEDPDANWGPFDATTIGWAADRHPGDAA